MRGPAAQKAATWDEASPAGEGRRGKPGGVTIASAFVTQERRSARPGGPLSSSCDWEGDPALAWHGIPPQSRRLSTLCKRVAPHTGQSLKNTLLDWP